MPETIVGIIGGSGLGEAITGTGPGEQVLVDTPFGRPSGPITITEFQGQKTAFLSRHGPGHIFHPSNVPYRANIFAMKKLGVTHIIASGATGSLREHIQPRDLVIADQVIDKTFRRAGTFFDESIVVHVEFSHPFCPALRQALLTSAKSLDVTVHSGGVYVCMEGPQFSTVAESNMHRSWGGDMIGMTCMPEAKLAREAEICYALVALPTDYDCWRPHDPQQDPASLLREIVHNLEMASQNAIQLIRRALSNGLKCEAHSCSCHDALRLAIWSDKKKISKDRLLPLRPLLEKYIEFDD